MCRLHLDHIAHLDEMIANNLQRLRDKLAEITRQLGPSSDVLGIGGRSDVVDRLLEDLTAEELDARLERAAQQVRD